MNFKKLTINTILILTLVLSIVIGEINLRFRRGLPPPDFVSSQFKFRYEDIYKRFFKKARLPDGAMGYKTQRERSSGHSFILNKDKDTRRIFVIGGSVAKIFNYPSGLNNLLNNSIPGLKFEILGCGMAAYDSYRELLILKEVVNYSPDLIILLSGNNEHYTPVKINILFYRLNSVFRNLWVYRELQERIRPHIEYPCISPEERKVNFEKNLKSMIRMAKKKNIPIALFTLPANFRDCPPGTSSPSWHDQQFFWAWHAFEQEDFNEAVKRFQDFIEVNPEDAFGYYFLAKSYDALQDYRQAQAYYLRALNLDAKPGDRTPPSRNEIIRRLCAEEELVLVDLEKAFIESTPDGLVGADLFHDNCHWWWDYKYLVDEEILRSIINYNKTYSRAVLAPLHEWQGLSAPTAAKSLEIDTQGRAFKMLLNAFSGQSYLVNERSISYIQSAYNLSPDLFKDEISFKGRILERFRLNFWSQDLLLGFDEDWPAFLIHIAEALRRLKLLPEAMEYFDRALNLNSELWFGYLGRALTKYNLGLKEEAKTDFDKANEKSSEHPLVKFYCETLDI